MYSVELISDDNNRQISSTKDKTNILGSHFESFHRANLHVGNTILTNNINKIINEKLYAGVSPLFKYNIKETADLNKTPISFYNNTWPNLIETNRQIISIEGVKPQTVANNFHIHFFKTEQISNVISSLNSKKSSGYDQISNVVIKKLS